MVFGIFGLAGIWFRRRGRGCWGFTAAPSYWLASVMGFRTGSGLLGEELPDFRSGGVFAGLGGAAD